MESKDINAEIFLNEIKKLKLSGREFLFLIGNSKLNNEAYNEIKENRQLTYIRLVELLDNSPLTSYDYERLILAAQKMRKAKENRVENKEATEPDRFEEQEKKEANETKAVDSHERIDFQQRAEQIRRYTENNNKTRELKKVQQPRFNQEFENRYDLHETPEVNQKENPLYTKKSLPVKNTRANKWAEWNENKKDSEDDDNYKVNVDYDEDDDDDNNNDRKYDDVFDDDENNNAKTVTCLILSLILIVMSFGIRYMNTGSFFLGEEDDLISQAPSSYSELAEILYKLSNSPVNPEDETQNADDYYIDLTAERYVNDKICNNNQYIFTVIDNGLYVTVPDTGNGDIKQVGFVEKDGFTINEIFLHEQRLYVVFEGEYASEFNSLNPLGSSNKENLTEIEPISGSFTQPVTLVEVYDAVQYNDTPLLTFEIDGEYDNCLTYSGGVYVFTDYYVKNAQAYDDLRAYIPSFSINGNEREFISFENIYVPLTGFKHSHMKAFCALDKNLETVFGAVLGGGEIETYVGNGSVLFVGQNGDNSNIIRYANGEYLSFVETEGIVTGIDERNGIIRVSAELEEFSRLYIYNDMLEPLSVIDSIAPGEKQKATLFDDRYAYIITDLLYTFDTSVPDEPIISEDSQANVYCDEFYRWSDKERLSVTVETDTQGKRTGIRLTMNKLEKGSYVEQSNILLIAEESQTGSEYIKTPVENDRNSLHINHENGIIVIPVLWFDGISEVERYLVIRYTEKEGFLNMGGLIFYDWNKNTHRAVCMGDYIYTFWDKTVVSMKIPDITAVKTVELN